MMSSGCACTWEGTEGSGSGWMHCCLLQTPCGKNSSKEPLSLCAVACPFRHSEAAPGNEILVRPHDKSEHELTETTLGVLRCDYAGVGLLSCSVFALPCLEVAHCVGSQGGDHTRMEILGTAGQRSQRPNMETKKSPTKPDQMGKIF